MTWNVYIAGPMRGVPQFNFPRFNAEADRLRRLGFGVCNPCDRDRALFGDGVSDSSTGDLADVAGTGFTLRGALAYDTHWIATQADAVAVLPGWEKSKGAAAEVALAEALDLPVIPVGDFREYRIIPPRTESNSTPNGEVRVTSPTGGQKGSKPARFDLIPARPLDLLARLYGKGAEKYDDHNWAQGYDWSLSFAAMQRHAWAFWSGEDTDSESGVPHVTAVAFHAFALAHFLTDPHRYKQFDNRWSVA